MAKKKKKVKKARNWHAINAFNRNSVGAIKDKKKDGNKKWCRKKDEST